MTAVATHTGVSLLKKKTLTIEYTIQVVKVGLLKTHVGVNTLENKADCSVSMQFNNTAFQSSSKI